MIFKYPRLIVALKPFFNRCISVSLSIEDTHTKERHAIGADCMPLFWLVLKAQPSSKTSGKTRGRIPREG